MSRKRSRQPHPESPSKRAHVDVLDENQTQESSSTESTLLNDTAFGQIGDTLTENGISINTNLENISALLTSTNQGTNLTREVMETVGEPQVPHIAHQQHSQMQARLQPQPAECSSSPTTENRQHATDAARLYRSDYNPLCNSSDLDHATNNACYEPISQLVSMLEEDHTVYTDSLGFSAEQNVECPDEATLTTDNLQYLQDPILITDNLQYEPILFTDNISYAPTLLTAIPAAANDDY